MKHWRKGIASWKVGSVLYLSVPFTWLVNEAIAKVKKHKTKVVVGGPGAMLLRHRFDDIAEVKDSAYPFEPVILHNPFATFTTRGCINKCKFCAVPKIEGEFREIPDFTPRPIVCDNNFLASSRKHFDNVIDKLKVFPYVDFNQGLEAKLFAPRIVDRLVELKHVRVRFAFDNLSDERCVVDAISLARKKGLNDIGCYVLFGFKDTPKEALYRVELLRALKVDVYAMRFQPLDTLKKNEFVAVDKGWTEYELKRFSRYWRGGHNLFGVPFKDYDHRKEKPKGFGFVPGIKDGRRERWGIEGWN